MSDEVFRAWLLRKQDDHEEGEELTPDELMVEAKNKQVRRHEGKGDLECPNS